ncbi:MAG: transporter [Thermodesulfobacteriota bacterium]|nr:transporter [Thermodesulfobacteriota bacterium]
MKIKKVANLFFVWCFIFLTFQVSFAAHPLITDDAGTQGKGKFQVELNGEYGREKEHGLREGTFEISSIFSYGLLDHLDVVLSVPYQFIRTKEEGEGGWVTNRENGFSDISFEVKWRFYEIEGFSFALKPGITLPAGNERKGLGAGRVTYSFHSIVTKEIGPLAFHANFGYFRNENKVNERKDLWHVSLATEVEVVKDLKIVGNIGMERNPEKDSHRNPAFLLGGVIYSVTENLVLDFGVKYGLNKPETDYTLLVGISFRF